MKRVLMLLIIYCLFSCKSSKVYDKNASDAVFFMISETKLELDKYNKGKKSVFKHSSELVELSGMKIEINSKNFISEIYIPNEDDIVFWENWFEKNKELFSYYENEGINKYYYQNKKKLIKFEYEPNKFRYSVSGPELIHIKEVAQKIEEKNK